VAEEEDDDDREPADLAGELDPEPFTDADDWQPSAALRGPLLLATVLTLVGGACTVAGAVWGLLHEPAEGFTPQTALEFAGLAALFPTLWAYAGLARELPSPALKGGAVCSWGSALVLSLLPLAQGQQGGEGTAWFLVWVIGLSLAGLALYAITFFPKGGGCLTSLGVVVAVGVKMVAAGAAKGAAKGAKLDTVLAVEWIAGLTATVVFWIWFAVLKIRRSGRLGLLAAVVGWTELLALAVITALLTWMAIDNAERQDDPGFNQQAWESEWYGLLMQGQMAVVTAWTVVTAAWFFLLRERAALAEEPPPNDWE
jgi:hypothetical protein